MEAIKIQRKYPQFTQEEVMSLVSRFKDMDVDSKGSITKQEAITALSSGPNHEGTYDSVRTTLKEVQVDSSGQIELEDYIDLIAKLRSGRNKSAGKPVGIPGKKNRVIVQGSNSNIQHGILPDELSAFTSHINSSLAGDSDIGDRLPLPTTTFQIFDEARDGLILCKLINDCVPDTIDERVLNKPSAKTNHKPINNFQMTENNNIVISSAKAIGCSVVNVGASDIIDGREHLILGLIWQIIRRGLLSKIDIKLHPELYRLLDEGETLDEFLRLPPDQILLRWFNYHLKAAKWSRRVKNFSKDICDSENYTVLLNQLMPDHCSRGPLQQTNIEQRAEEVLQNAEKIGCRKFLTSKSILAGNPKLNLAFVANLFNTYPGLEALEESERPVIEDFDVEGEREARVFTLWLNSLNVDPGVYNLFEDLKDGTVILQAFDKVIPGCVTWRRVSRPKEEQELSRFKCVENTNYAVELGQANRMTLVGVQGADIVDGTKTLVLGLVWQLMRKSVIATLASLSKGNREVTDSDMIRWANDRVRGAGKHSSMRSFKDSTLRTGHFYLDLLDALKPGYVDYSLVYPGKDEDECTLNNKLAISIARKAGALIFVVPEDLVEVLPRLGLTFIAALMALAPL
ncbi:fimbrin [Puccinia striiformis f. sp. tritici PST-78]|uniref:Fimbrin n=1 Tax=Puccinia striiformis f. sp. tritici PST-78 TaxID=1165861 RepID=A0A0L0VBF2_9BASI|nr:fimbrin [Puccinia striiformis f. sp. tritici PST-78]